jgi:tripartite ATP-independent transporter DctM subunit
VAAAYALFLALAVYRSLSMKALLKVFQESAHTSASVGLVISAALIFNYIVATENIPTQVAQLLVSWELSNFQFLMTINMLFLLLGMVLDATTVILVIVPLLVPACRELGIDLVHFGIITVMNLMIGLITPPYGILLFVINGTTKIPINEIVRNVVPFIIVLIGALMLLTSLPDLVLYMPRIFGYDG